MNKMLSIMILWVEENAIKNKNRKTKTKMCVFIAVFFFFVSIIDHRCASKNQLLVVYFTLAFVCRFQLGKKRNEVVKFILLFFFSCWRKLLLFYDGVID